MVEEAVPISERASESVSILISLSPEQTSKTKKVLDPFVTLSEHIESPKQKDFPTNARIGSGSISGSSIYKYLKQSVNFKLNYI